MRKIIPVGSLLGFLLLFASLSVNAQSGFESKVDVPFPFTIGERTYEAGKYNLKVANAPSGSKILTLADKDHKVLHVTFIHINGERPSKSVRLVFDTVGGVRYLTKIRSRANTYELVKSNAHKVELAKSKRSKTGADVM